MSTYLTAPVPTKKLPGGIPYIIGNEAAERFSFYGMKGILVVFMTGYLSLLPGAVGNEPMSDTDAIANYHLFTTAVYFTPILGALLSDILLGKYLTIMILSIVYCIGHGALALMGLGEGIDPGWMLFLGLGLIAFGSGGIKPCVSAHVGDQFGASNGHASYLKLGLVAQTRSSWHRGDEGQYQPPSAAQYCAPVSTLHDAGKYAWVSVQ